MVVLPILLSAQGTSAVEIIFAGIRVENYFVLAAVVDAAYQGQVIFWPVPIPDSRRPEDLTDLATRMWGQRSEIGTGQ